MELIYAWVAKFRGFENQGFHFSSRFKISFEPNIGEYSERFFGKLNVELHENYVEIYPENVTVTGLIGKNGTGKTSILDLLQDYSLAESKNDSVFFVFYKEGRILFNGIKIAGAKNRDYLELESLPTSVVMELTDFRTTELTSISYKNTIEAPSEVVFNTPDYLDNKYNISSSQLLYKALKGGNCTQSYYKYYSDDILRAILLFSNHNSNSKVHLPFLIPERISISCNHNLSKRSTKLFLEVFEQNEYVDIESVYDENTIIDSLIHSVKSMQHKHNTDKLIDVLQLRGSTVPAGKPLTLVESQDILDKLERVKPEVYLNFSNPLKLIYQAVENVGDFNDLLLLNIINNYLVYEVKSAPYRGSILIELFSYLRDVKQNFKLNLEVKNPWSHRRNYDVVLDRYRSYLSDIYKIIKNSTDNDFFEHADRILLIFKNLYNTDDFKSQNNMTVYLIKIDYRLMDSYFKLVFVGEKFLSFDWFPKLSSGQLAHVTFYSRLYRLLEYPQEHEKLNKNILLLIDEGDLTLHPQWQKTYVSWLVEFLFSNFKDKYKFQIILTSHSSFISSDLFESNQIFLNSKEDNYTLRSELTNTFGANIHTLLSSGFFINGSLMGDYAHKVITDVIKCFDRKTEKECCYTQIELKKIISQIGEKFLKDKLLNMYSEKFKVNIEKEKLLAKRDEIDRELENLEKQSIEGKNA